MGVLDDLNAVVATSTFDLIRDDFNGNDEVARSLLKFVRDTSKGMVTVGVVEDSVGSANSIRAVHAMVELGSGSFNVSTPGFRIPFIGVYKNGFTIQETTGPYEGAVSTSVTLSCLDSRSEYIQMTLADPFNETGYSSLKSALSSQHPTPPQFSLEYTPMGNVVVIIYVICSEFLAYFNSTLFERDVATVRNITCSPILHHCRRRSRPHLLGRRRLVTHMKCRRMLICSVRSCPVSP